MRDGCTSMSLILREREHEPIFNCLFAHRFSGG